MTPREKTALVVVDLQRDFCVGEVAASRYQGDLASLASVTANAARAVASARGRGIEVVFVRFLGDVEHQGPSWRRRDRVLGKQPKCRAGSRGAEFHQVSPAPGEQVFTKRACFDAFLSDGFERHLLRRGIGHLVFAGLYTDVCVDSTARTAFQKGFHVTVLTDCTASLHLPAQDILRFMRVVYGAGTTTHDQLDTWSRLPGEEVGWPTHSTGTPA
ncbi:cysteine hydrolase family protein [Goodfellowiella coeruleoviolacea]|uniref:Nicotinamidase-related amidase n=1 Tax=Goodfellowiella coeruleoviolacea TaxID=334858 RepID=A0AAE3GQ66_9PSEU|nr:isochorismatase family cysteine hydrolase [Goodfellowiella coeruleoviolacea]MCP2170143.1 Nicotinamidase-related amidase [Goodfellowiella coeruleoviolacea]